MFGVGKDVLQGCVMACKRGSGCRLPIATRFLPYWINSVNVFAYDPDMIIAQFHGTILIEYAACQHKES